MKWSIVWNQKQLIWKSNSGTKSERYFYLYQSTRNVVRDRRELFEQWRRRRQRDLRKSKRFRLVKQQFCTRITLFWTFLCHHCTTTTWKYLTSFFKADVKKRRCVFLSLFKLEFGPKKTPPGQFAYIWHFRRIGIKATKFILKVRFSLPSPSSMLKLPSVSPIPRVQYFKFHHMLPSNLVAPFSVRALKILQLRVGLAGRCCVQLHYGPLLGNKFWPSLLCNFFTANETSTGLETLC